MARLAVSRVVGEQALSGARSFRQRLQLGVAPSVAPHLRISVIQCHLSIRAAKSSRCIPQPTQPPPIITILTSPLSRAGGRPTHRFWRRREPSFDQPGLCVGWTIQLRPTKSCPLDPAAHPPYLPPLRIRSSFQDT